MIYTREQAERRHQGHFFDKSALRFFGSRIGRFYPVPGGAYFVTSEKQDHSSPRRYTVRFISDEGQVTTRYGYLCGFQRFISSTGANRIALRLQQVANAVSIKTPAS